MSGETLIRFDDGAAYEKFMGVWSRKVGEIFLDWIRPQKGLAWIDVGCGNGAFSELIIERCAPKRVLGVDPSEAQLDYARQRHKAGLAQFVNGDAMALPAESGTFDVAVMALVIFFVPEPAKGIAEMMRVVKPGRSISAYAWDMPGGGFPVHLLTEELEKLGIKSPMPPSADISALPALRALWKDAGMTDVETREIKVERTFPDFEELWSINMSGPRMAMLASQMSPELLATLKANTHARLANNSGGPITCSARANAVMGKVPL